MSEPEGPRRSHMNAALLVSVQSAVWTVASSSVAVWLGIHSRTAVLVAFGAIGLNEQGYGLKGVYGLNTGIDLAGVAKSGVWGDSTAGTGVIGTAGSDRPALPARAAATVITLTVAPLAPVEATLPADFESPHAYFPQNPHYSCESINPFASIQLYNRTCCY